MTTSKILTPEQIKEIAEKHFATIPVVFNSEHMFVAVESAIREALELVERGNWLPSIEQVEEKLLADVPGKRQVDSAMRQGFRGCYDWIISLSPTPTERLK